MRCAIGLEQLLAVPESSFAVIALRLACLSPLPLLNCGREPGALLILKKRDESYRSTRAGHGQKLKHRGVTDKRAGFASGLCFAPAADACSEASVVTQTRHLVSTAHSPLSAQDRRAALCSKLPLGGRRPQPRAAAAKRTSAAAQHRAAPAERARAQTSATRPTKPPCPP